MVDCLCRYSTLYSDTGLSLSSERSEGRLEKSTSNYPLIAELKNVYAEAESENPGPLDEHLVAPGYIVLAPSCA